MKNLLLISIVFLVFSFYACGQKDNVPEKVKTAFEQQFTDAKKVKWERENNTEWEVEFIMNDNEYSANFDNKGNWLETEYEVDMKDIPAAVKSTLANEFAGYETEESEILKNADGTFYEFELEKDETEIDIVIDLSGKVVKKEVETEDNKDDED